MEEEKKPPFLTKCQTCGCNHSSIYLPYCPNPDCPKYNKYEIRERRPRWEILQKEVADVI